MIRRRLYEILEAAADPDDKASLACDYFLLSLIVASVVASMAESVHWIHEAHGEALHRFEIFSMILFTTEYLLRLWCCTVEEGYEHPVWGRIRYALQPMVMIDLAAILPFFLGFLAVDLRTLRVLRLLRIFRLGKMARYSPAVQSLATVFWVRRQELFVTFFVGILVILFSASLIWAVEHDAQPKVFSSIPAACWWSVATLTTIGYGDMAPVTDLGRFLASLIAMTGLGIFALPAGILGSAFVEETNRQKEERRRRAERRQERLHKEAAGLLAPDRDQASVAVEDAAQELAERIARGDACPHCGGRLD